MRRKLSAIAGLGIVVAMLAGILMAGLTRDVREAHELRQQMDPVRLTGPHGPPQLVPPRAPGPGVIA